MRGPSFAPPQPLRRYFPVFSSGSSGAELMAAMWNDWNSVAISYLSAISSGRCLYELMAMYSRGTLARASAAAGSYHGNARRRGSTCRTRQEALTSCGQKGGGPTICSSAMDGLTRELSKLHSPRAQFPVTRFAWTTRCNQFEGWTLRLGRAGAPVAVAGTPTATQLPPELEGPAVGLGRVGSAGKHVPSFCSMPETRICAAHSMTTASESSEGELPMKERPVDLRLRRGWQPFDAASRRARATAALRRLVLRRR